VDEEPACGWVVNVWSIYLQTPATPPVVGVFFSVKVLASAAGPVGEMIGQQSDGEG